MAVSTAPIQLQLSTVERYIRRKTLATPPAAWRFNGVDYTGLAGLKLLADAIFPEATQTVTLRSNSFEGGHAEGEITFDKTVLLTAIENLIAELDPDDTPQAPSSTVLLDYSHRAVHC